MFKDDCIVKTSVAPLYSKPTFKSEMVTQALVWEYLLIFDKKDSWYKVKQIDGYVSWIHEFYLIDAKYYHRYKNGSEWILVNKTFHMYPPINRSAKFISIGTKLPYQDDHFFYPPFLGMHFSNYEDVDPFYYKSHYDFNDIDFQSLLGIPYLWGGRSSIGFDCSGLVQTLYALTGCQIPRDTSEQIKSDKLFKIKNKTELGDLIFFKKDSKVCHVGLYINKNEFIHSSGYVKYGSIIKNNKFFDIELFEMEYELYRFKQ